MSTPDNLDDEPGTEPAPYTRPVRPSREMPASEEAETSLLGACLIDDGATLTRAMSEGITADSFYWPSHRIIFNYIAALSDNGQPISIETLTAELMEARKLSDIGGPQKLLSFPASTTAHAGYFIEKVRTLSILRESIKAHTAAVEDAYSFTGDLDNYLQVTQARVEAVSRGPAQAKLKDLEAKIEILRVNAAKPPKEPVTRLFLADKPIATSGNLVTIISKAKTGKTTALGAIVAAIIVAITGTSALKHDTFKFRSSNPEGHAVIVIDTEQSPYDAFLCYQRSLKRANHVTDPKWLLHYSLVGYSPGDLHTALDIILARAVRDFGGVFMIILDGVADFVASVNDEAESNAIVTWLRSRSVTYDTPILCVIHSNEAEKSGDDGRGHLGKQLIRKAESNLLLKKDGEITTITSDKQRKAPITKNDKVAFRWSEEAQMHLSCDPSGSDEPTTRSGRPTAYKFSDFVAIFPRADKPAMTRAQLFRFAADFSPIKETAFRDLLARAVQDGELLRIPDGAGFKYRLPAI